MQTADRVSHLQKGLKFIVVASRIWTIRCYRILSDGSAQDAFLSAHSSMGFQGPHLFTAGME
jgi:hypothetical protein